MEATMATLAQSPFGNCRVCNSVSRSVSLNAQGPGFMSFRNNFGPSIKHKRPGLGIRRALVVRASSAMSPESRDSDSQIIAPLQMESPIGQFLSQILASHPHLVPAAVEQQLELLQTDRDAQKNEEPSPAGTDLVLYRRIAEVKANERKKTVEEILYALVVQKFMDAKVSLVSSISASESWPAQDEKLKQIHSPEAAEMIQNHLSLILGNRLTDSTTAARISQLRVGQVYAASVMYGYFLRRVDQRFQLEKAMKILSDGAGEEEEEPAGPHPEGSTWAMIKASRLRTYVMSFDAETLQRYATIRSKEAVGIIEKHTEALFGRPESVDPTKDDSIKISFRALKMLVLEAVTFGSFLWDVESFVDARYQFLLN